MSENLINKVNCLLNCDGKYCKKAGCLCYNEETKKCMAKQTILGLDMYFQQKFGFEDAFDDEVKTIIIS